MQLTVDAAHLGTPESAWLGCARLVGAPAPFFAAAARAVVIAPHPDDEVLGVGGIMHALGQAGFDVRVIAVTDGEASHPHAPSLSPAELATQRATERGVALGRLGLAAARVTRLEVPDGRVAAEPFLADRLSALLEGAALCFAPWEHDGHPDHDATGRAALIACAQSGARLVQYPIWAWHWARPGSSDLPWQRLRRAVLGPDARMAKRAAIRAYRTQIMPLGPRRGEEAILPPPVLARFHRPFEVVFT